MAAIVAMAMAAIAVAGAAAGETQPEKPSWMTIDAANKKVTLDVMAGWNSNNGVLNFNGYYDGDATVVIPVGWSAEVKFGNNDGYLPHSLLVTKPFAKADMPETAGSNKVAIPRAYTRSPAAGIAAGETDGFRFTAGAPGEYYFLCGAPGHAQSGMWIHMSVSADAAEPGVIVAPGATPGRDGASKP
ncbi:MAG TPA: sulfocyanin-like copper-binding protein [Alphaproteobacteria bacterium]|nr:sulfocyanin-like copper-binding protein [Alphaproteobacteria bacterium]